MYREINNDSVTRHNIRVGLRGKLSKDYTTLRNNSEEAASKWLRNLVKEATGGHPQLLVRMVDEPGTKWGQKMVIGLRSEVGKYGDW